MKDYCKHVLFVGPHYRLRGGMASVLEVYSRTIQNFNFLSTYYKKNPLLSMLYFAKAMASLLYIFISNRQIKIVHIHAACRGSFIRKSIVLLASKLFGKKTILHIHGGEFKAYYANAGILKPYIAYILNAATELAVLSEEWKIYFDGVTQIPKSVVVNNPVFMPDAVPANKVSSPVNLLYLNHVTSKKGLFDIVDVLIKNKEALQGVFKLNIAGAGAELDKLQQLITNHQLQQLVEYKGWVSGSQKDELIRNCNAFILTSYYEGLPMSILESMAWGKPIISSNVGGIPTIVKPGINGWLLKAGDTQALEAILMEIKNDNTVLEKYSTGSLAIVQDYSPEKVVEKLNEIYSPLLGNKKIIKNEAMVV
jgi:glycosyltransferase involved in cell wall biosynthesis